MFNVVIPCHFVSCILAVKDATGTMSFTVRSLEHDPILVVILTMSPDDSLIVLLVDCLPKNVHEYLLRFHRTDPLHLF